MKFNKTIFDDEDDDLVPVNRFGKAGNTGVKKEEKPKIDLSLIVKPASSLLDKTKEDEKNIIDDEEDDFPIVKKSFIVANTPRKNVEQNIKNDFFNSLEDIDFNDSINKSDFEFVNDFQVVYKPFSKVNVTGAVVPVSLAYYIKEALTRLETELNMSVDEYVCSQCGWTKEELGKYLSSEQADAVALALYATGKGEAEMIADMTGFGKGRILASVARAQILSGKKIIFFSEKANLFSDFWRDIMDINSDDIFGNPFILNDKTIIIDKNSTEDPPPVLFKTDKPAIVNEVLKTGEFPENCKIIMTTYSQFNRKNSLKSKILSKLMKDKFAIADECHNMAGDSATMEIVGGAFDGAYAEVYSSATYGRHLKNLMVYKKIFTWLKNIRNLEEMTSAQKRMIAEASNVAAVRAGRIIRREHDLSDMVLELVTDTNVNRNRILADKLSPILSSMARLSSVVTREVFERNENNKILLEDLSPDERKENRVVYSIPNFGLKLNAVVNQFWTALCVDLCVEECLKALKNNQRPVVVIENTMESLMKELASDNYNSESTEQIELFDEEENTEGKPPSFKDALKLMLHRIVNINVRKSGEKLSEEINNAKIEKLKEKINDLINSFPELPLSPIDDIIQRVEAESVRLHENGELKEPCQVEEISARTMKVVDGQYVPMTKRDRNEAVANFVNGRKKCVVITRAASTGLSLHDSEKFLDHAQKVLIELSASQDVLVRTQTWGRVWRRGQRTSPLFKILFSGLKTQEKRILADNRKMRELQSSVTGSSKTKGQVNIDDPVDLIGNMIAKKFFEDNPKIAEEMLVTMKVELDDPENELYYINKFMNGLNYLVSTQGDKLYEQIVDQHKEYCQQHVVNTDGDWEIAGRKLFQDGDGTNDPIYGHPVLLTKIKRTEIIKPILEKEIREEIRKNKEKLTSHTGYNKFYFKGYAEQISKNKDDYLKDKLPKKFKNLRMALIDRNPNSIKVIHTKLTNAIEILQKIEPGNIVKIPVGEGIFEKAFVVDVRPPEITESTSLRDYKIDFAVPGEDKYRTLTLDFIVQDLKSISPTTKDDAEEFYSEFKDIGFKTVERYVLDGNPLLASLIAIKLGGGQMFSYNVKENDKNEERTGVLIPRNMENKLKSFPVQTRNMSTIKEILKNGDVINAGDNNEIYLFEEHGHMKITFPPQLNYLKEIKKTGLLDITGELKGEYPNKYTYLSSEQTIKVVECLINNFNYVTIPGKYRKKMTNENNLNNKIKI